MIFIIKNWLIPFWKLTSSRISWVGWKAGNQEAEGILPFRIQKLEHQES